MANTSKKTNREDNKQSIGNNPEDSRNHGVDVKFSSPYHAMPKNSTSLQVLSNDSRDSWKTATPLKVSSKFSEDQKNYRNSVRGKQRTVSLKSAENDIENQEQTEESNFHGGDSLTSPRIKILTDEDSKPSVPKNKEQIHLHDDIVLGETISRNASSISQGSSQEEISARSGKNFLSSTLPEDETEDDNPTDFVQCPFFSLRTTRHDQETKNVTCVPHKPSERDCKKAHKYYELDRQPLKCSSKAQDPLCSFEKAWRSSKRDRLVLECDISPCGQNPVHVIALDPAYGSLEDRAKWQKFATTGGLEEFLSTFVITTSLNGFNFCFLACRGKDNKEYVEQILYFPPIMEKVRNRAHKRTFNVNIVVLDSVSRPHFYRSLTNTVNTLREEDNATVLDFELLQSSAAYTFQNIRAFMSGKTNFASHQSQTYGIEVLFGHFKRNNYYTLLQEDSCWYDSWGSLFTNNLYQGEKPYSKAEFLDRWKAFKKQAANYFIDDYGLSYTSCEVFRRYNTTNQFNQPRRVCFGGRVFAEFFLDYVEGVYVASKASGQKQSILSYTHLNIGHEVTGTRIRQIDTRLSRFLRKMAKDQDTLTIVLSDHGPKTTSYSFHTMEGRTEIYNPLLFMIIPRNVTHILGMERMKSLTTNQYRLLSTLDLHRALMSVGGSLDSDQHSVLTVIPANRTCADFNLRPSVVCKCKDWEKRFSYKDESFLWMAELALGTINNKIQKQYLKGGKRTAGFGKCQRLVGKGIAKVRRRTLGDEYVATMDLIVKPDKEIFEIQVRYPRERNGRRLATLSFSQRITIYRHFSRCVDTNVSINLCVCLYDKQRQDHHKIWTQIQTKQDVLRVIAESKSFNAITKVRDLHGGCLLLMTRNHGSHERTKILEASNACHDRRYIINVSAEKIENIILSRELPFSTTLLPRTIHFLLTVYHLQKPYDFKGLVSYDVEFL